MNPVSVLFVCLGNICRSPLAEGIFKRLVEQRGFSEEILCDSAGTAGYHEGADPDHRSMEIAKRNGIALNHIGRKLKEEDFQNFDYIVAMDQSNFGHLKSHKANKPGVRAKVFKMMDYDNAETGNDVPDPYYGGTRGFEIVYDMLHEACNNLLDHIVKENKLEPKQ